LTKTKGTRPIKRILVVEDEATIRELIADAVREAGFCVDTAANGVEALRVMHRNLPHAIVLDLMMPILDAAGFVELKRLDARFAPIPILVVTAAYGAHDVAERLGARACLTKPFELDDLVQRLILLAGPREAEPNLLVQPARAGRQIVAES
jgi:two-component system, OmpR family, response regulator